MERERIIYPTRESRLTPEDLAQRKAEDDADDEKHAKEHEERMREHEELLAKKAHTQAEAAKKVK